MRREKERDLFATLVATLFGLCITTEATAGTADSQSMIFVVDLASVAKRTAGTAASKFMIFDGLALDHRSRGRDCGFQLHDSFMD